MLRHVVMFRLAPDAPPETPRRLEEGLAELARSIPEIERYEYGADRGLREGNFDFCLVADFADADAFRRYVDHPDHRRFVAERLTPVAAERIAVQYAL